MFRSLLTLTKLASPQYIFPTVDPKIDGEECRHDCADCTVKWPSKVKVDTTPPMYGCIKQFHAHVLVATGKTDWMEKVEQEKGSLMEAFKSDAGKSKHGNLTPPESGDGEIDSGKTTVLLLPSFTFVDDVSYGDIRHVVDACIDNPKQESRLSSQPCPHGYVVLLSSHQRQDARCGITAPLIKKQLERHLRGHGLYRNPDDERPGAVKPEHCEGVVKYTILQGKVVHPDRS
ncbi:Sucrase/ferredoxin-like-domain-containing protein [Aspergillus novoparasiticus]|uniref:Sucrase/ferredoxin-like-domain-containing protein n=1 Tax=Aspergillus novoparasiticus TaxID=986946 RepID=A0A5N6ET17_9EURO|nr:Sucrase/ferredoxin-like-domain-containing protein [Aspergillus novoparasiticus]